MNGKEQLNMIIGNNIKRIRQNKGVTQEQLGDSIGVSGQAVSKWENGSALSLIRRVLSFTSARNFEV